MKAADRLAERNRLIDNLAAVDALLRQLFAGRYSHRVGAQCRTLIAERLAMAELLTGLGGDPGELPASPTPNKRTWK